MEHHQIDCTPFGFTAAERRFLKRKKEPFFSDRQWDILMFVSFIVFLSALIFFITTVFGLTDVAQASDAPYYPATNRGTCERVRDQGLQVSGASMEQTKKWCAKEGVDL